MFFWDDCYGWFLAMKSSAYVYDHSFLYIVAVYVDGKTKHTHTDPTYVVE